jgi:hypothetical protein
MKKRYFFGLSAMLLALALLLAGCELLGGLFGGDDGQTTYDPLIITGKDSSDRSVVVEFNRQPSAKAARSAMGEPKTGDSYEIRVGTSVVSSGTITVVKPQITFNPASGSGTAQIIGTYTGGQDLAFSIPGVITEFYVPGSTKVAKPVANPSTSTTAKLPLTVTLTAASGAEIYYTTDDSAPGPAKTKYTGPITLSSFPNGKAIKIRAIATKGDMAQSDEMSETYSNPVPKPSFTPADENIPDGTTVTINTTDGAKIYWAYTVNGETPPDPTPSDTVGTNDGVTRGITSSFQFSFSGDKDMTIKAIASKDGMTNSEVSTTTYKKKTATSGPNDDTKNQFGADDTAIKVVEKDGKTTIYIIGSVRAAKDIAIGDNWTLQIGGKYPKPTTTDPAATEDATNASLTVDAGKTITVSGNNAFIKIQKNGTLVVDGSVNIGSGGKLNPENNGLLKANGRVTVSSGGELKIGADATLKTLNVTIQDAQENDGKLEGSGTLIVKDGGKMYIPDTTSAAILTDTTYTSNRFSLGSVTGAIEVEKGGELFIIGLDTVATAEAWYPWIGKADSKGKNLTTPVGADFVLDSGYITLKPNKASSSGPVLPYMILDGNATVLGPKVIPTTTTTPVTERSSVSIPSMFTVNRGFTLTIGNTSNKPVSTLIVTTATQTAGKLINNGTVVLTKDSEIKAETANDVVGRVVDSDGKTLTYDDTAGKKGWFNASPPPK